jgi:diguanylate cyclase (GGDEF)-like protein
MASAFLDVDWFKNVNDRHGHLIGSHVLRELGGLLRRAVRESDVAVRYGGDEFVLVLTETGREGALQMADRLRRRIEKHDFGQKMEKKIRITASIGVAVYPQHGGDASDLIHRADLAMYVAKHQARKNSVELAVE